MSVLLNIKVSAFRGVSCAGLFLVALSSSGFVSAASVDVYQESLLNKDSRGSALEAMRLMGDLSLAGEAGSVEVMQTAERLMTAAVASGDERTVKWVSAGILKGAGEANFDAAELGIRYVVDGSRYQSHIAQVTSDARTLMNLPAPVAEERAVAVVEAEADEIEIAEISEVVKADRSFLAELFDINRSSWDFSNRFSMEYDSNLYSNTSEEKGFVFKDAVSMSLSASSPRTAVQVYYKPTLEISPEKEVGDVELYHRFMGLLSHELSERNLLRFSDTFSFRDDETAVGTSGVVDNAYWMNDFSVGLERLMADEARLSLSTGVTLKRYSETTQQYKDYKTLSLGATYSKNLNETTFGSLSTSFMTQDYDSASEDKGTSVMYLGAGVNHRFNQDLVFDGSAGLQFVKPDGEGGENKTVPNVNGSVIYSFSPDTTLTALAGYSYNEDSIRSQTVGSEQLDLALSMRHNFSAQLLGSVKLSRQVETYSIEFSNLSSEDVTTYTTFDARMTYKINRIHSVDAGYNFRKTESDDYEEYDRHRMDLGWTVKF